MKPTTLIERCHEWNRDLAVDLDQRIVRNIALAGIASRNGYSYSENSLKEALQLYEGKPVFLDHAPNRKQPQERSTRDLVGSIVNVTFEDQRIRGDIRVLDTESGQTFLKLLDVETTGIGMSHVVRAIKSTDGKSVEKIAEVISVDVVMNPATTTTFSESTQPQDIADEVLQLRGEHKQLQQRNSELLTLVESLQSEKRVQELLTESHLPDRAVTDFFVQQLRDAQNDTIRRRLIDDRRTLVNEESTGRNTVHSQERILTDSETVHANDNFIRVIKRT